MPEHDPLRVERVSEVLHVIMENFFHNNSYVIMQLNAVFSGDFYCWKEGYY